MKPEQRIDAIRAVMNAEKGLRIKEIVDKLRGTNTPVKEKLLRSTLHAYKEHFVQDPNDGDLWYLRYRSAPAPGGQPSESPATATLYAWQQEALARWTAAGRRGVVEAVTGAGKSRLGVAAIVERVAAGGFATIIVPTVDLLYQWRDTVESDPAGLSVGLLGDGNDDVDRGTDVLIAVVHSASRRDIVAGRDGGLLVADECHRYGAPTFAQALQVEYSHRLGLTATLERSDDGVDEFLMPYFGSVVFEYDFRTAISENVCAPVRVGLVGVDLDRQERVVYDAESKKMGDAIHQLEGKCGLRFEPFWKFMAEVAQLAEQQEWSPCRGHAQAFLSAMTKRREILASASAKMAALAGIAPLVGEAGGCFLFTETKVAARDVVDALKAEHVVAEVLSGESGRDERRRTLDALRAGKLDAVAAPRILDEGIDAPSVDLGVIVAASRSRRQMIQRMGRVLRRKPDGRSANFLILYVRDTHEDPARDAHAEFLSEMLDVAEAIEVFGPSRQDSLRRFMAGDNGQGPPLTRAAPAQAVVTRRKAKSRPDPKRETRPSTRQSAGRQTIVSSGRKRSAQPQARNRPTKGAPRPNKRDKEVAALLGWPALRVSLARRADTRLRQTPSLLEPSVAIARSLDLSVAELDELLRAERAVAEQREARGSQKQGPREGR